MNFGAQVATATENNVRVVTHEIAHALGFSVTMLQSHSSVVQIPGLRGKSNVLVVASPRTLEKTRAHFNCGTAPGMELEDEGGEGTALSHWERRNAKDELMSGIAGAGYYTALTMGAMEDLGFYKAVWGMEEPMSWGRMSGCKLLTDKCVENGVTAYPDMFCTADSDTLRCTSDRRALGICRIGTYTSSLPTQYQYFANPTVGSSASNLMDYCPYIAEYTNTGCTNGELLAMPGSRVSSSSRCVKGDSLHLLFVPIGDVCAEIKCKKDMVQLRYIGDNTWYDCPEGRSIIPALTFTSGRIVCPSRADVCIGLGDKLPDLSISISVLPPYVLLAVVISVIALC
ncbi:putative surface protease GP63 [Trypanosoma theileri]|uniref:Leishmanolysin-like peptidase n=1 Tax=Trypanosoma theileri TaxID=67003 RepID=A0A1X0NR02_9TRYP|nr:putative surface protease GP63 [Trypanosoma theileri]ORC86550.1 putative surface protease GP63 [Trypanosoma theileri]